MKHRPVRLMHTVPEDHLIVNNGRRAHGWQFQIGRSLIPGDALSCFGIRRERVECRGIEGAQARDEDSVAPGHRRSDKMILLTLEDPQNIRASGTGLPIDIPCPLSVAAIREPSLGRLAGE